MIRPLVFGYIQVDLTDVGLPRRSEADRRDLNHFTAAEGYTIAEVFTDVRAGRGRFDALESLLEAATFTPVIAVVVPDWSHLGGDRDTADRTHTRIVEVTGLPVLAARLP